MKITEICFTCSGHAQTAANHDRPREGVRRVWVVDELDGQIAKAKPEGVEVWVIPFPRGGNLNGWECLAGMMDTFRRAFAEGADAIIKRDSDTRVLDDAQMTTLPEGKVALFVNRGSKPRWRGWGAGYTILPAAMPVMQDAIDNRDWMENRVPEDLFFSFSLRKVSWMLPLNACEFRMEARWPEWKPGIVWTNFNNRRETQGYKDVWWPEWPVRD